MELRQAVVKNGRLTLDQPTDLPEGRVVILVAVEDLMVEAGLDGVAGEEDGSGSDEVEPVAFRLASGPYEWREPKRIGAEALLEELRSLE